MLPSLCLRLLTTQFTQRASTISHVDMLNPARVTQWTIQEVMQPQVERFLK